MKKRKEKKKEKKLNKHALMRYTPLYTVSSMYLSPLYYSNKALCGKMDRRVYELKKQRNKQTKKKIACPH